MLVVELAAHGCVFGQVAGDGGVGVAGGEARAVFAVDGDGEVGAGGWFFFIV